ncbi:hypothetical protein ACFVQ3_18605 [Oerskovia sp. NPDC057915]|uniref:hypothetical protein n=1 Tax=Oerskovia sp. NPDC057915 TaxID=3346280 RepID=UPI0036DE6D29
MELRDSPEWSRKKLHKLGKALLAGDLPPDGCPTYEKVMLWHHELASEVAGIIANTRWSTFDSGLRNTQLRVSSRGKTLDTLVQKLGRSGIGLENIQDIAGVRVDGDFTLRQQTLFAEVLADHFEVEEQGKRDLRNEPHSGYRAFHLWVRCPAGRVEIQIRTEGQSEWANTYERLGDRIGRGIRYDEPAPDSDAQATVEAMHRLSHSLRVLEELRDFSIDLGPEYVGSLLKEATKQGLMDERSEDQRTVPDIQVVRSQLEQFLREYVAEMQALRRSMDRLEEV